MAVGSSCIAHLSRSAAILTQCTRNSPVVGWTRAALPGGRLDWSSARAENTQPGPIKLRPGPLRCIKIPAKPGPVNEKPGPARPGPARPGPARPGPSMPLIFMFLTIPRKYFHSFVFVASHWKVLYNPSLIFRLMSHSKMLLWHFIFHTSHEIWLSLQLTNSTSSTYWTETVLHVRPQGANWENNLKQISRRSVIH